MYGDGAYASFSNVDVGQNLPYHSPEQPTHLQNESYKFAKEACDLLTMMYLGLIHVCAFSASASSFFFSFLDHYIVLVETAINGP